MRDAGGAGTATGDILRVNIGNRLFKHIGPKTRLSQGVLSIAPTPDGKLLVGAGDGSISVIHPETLKVPPPRRSAAPRSAPPSTRPTAAGALRQPGPCESRGPAKAGALHGALR